MSAAVILPNLNTNNTSSSRNIRRSEKFFKRFQKEIELSNSRLSISDTNSTSRLNNSSETNSATSISPNLKTYHRIKTPSAQIIQIHNKTTSQNLSTPGSLSTPNINNHNNSNNNANLVNNRNNNTHTETHFQPIKHVKLNRSSSSLSTSGLKSASSASTTIYYKFTINFILFIIIWV